MVSMLPCDSRQRGFPGKRWPVRALVRIEHKHCFGALIGVERSKKPVGALRYERRCNDAMGCFASFTAIPGAQCSCQEQNGQTQLVMDAHRRAVGATLPGSSVR
jgi:hypothetical protein